jgi:DUF971 family protein
LAVRPIDITTFPSELALKWDNGGESFIPLETLRRFCPCAACMGETDVMGQVYKAPARPYTDHSFVLTGVSEVGGYGLQPRWGDGHATGIYTWDYLRRLAEAQ